MITAGWIALGMMIESYLNEGMLEEEMGLIPMVIAYLLLWNVQLGVAQISSSFIVLSNAKN